MSKQYNTPDVDDTPPPAYQELAPPFNPNYQLPSSPSFNPHYNPPHTPEDRPEGSQRLYPQIPVPSPSSPSPMNFPQPQHYHPQQQQHQQYQPQPQPHRQQQPPRQQYFPQQVRYQTIEIPYSVTTNARIRRNNERRKFPLGAIFFLFGWFCPPLWVIGACCCAGSRNEYESFWGKVNFIMAMALIVSSVVYSIIAMSDYI